ncbi:hypothetical protein ACJX0J_014296, partial [Zea mays]
IKKTHTTSINFELCNEGVILLRSGTNIFFVLTQGQNEPFARVTLQSPDMGDAKLALMKIRVFLLFSLDNSLWAQMYISDTFVEILKNVHLAVTIFFVLWFTLNIFFSGFCADSGLLKNATSIECCSLLVQIFLLTIQVLVDQPNVAGLILAGSLIGKILGNMSL